MSILRKKQQQEEEKASVYVIDEDFHIVFSNEEIEDAAPNGKQQHCYEILAHESSQCQCCPLRETNQGKAVMYNSHRKEMVKVNSTPLYWPEHGQCYIIVADSVKEESISQWERCYSSVSEGTDANEIFNKKYFFVNAEKKLKDASGDVRWCMLAIDIENLKLLNEWYGREAGDKLLAGIAGCLKKQQNDGGGIAGYFGDDDFALLMQYDEEQVKRIYKEITNLLDAYSNKTGFMPAFGIYEIEDRQESVFSMYDKAALARMSVRGSYTSRMKKFDAKMVEKLESNYVLFSDVRKALAEKDFTFYLQPKCNMENGKIIGAEALVRWMNPEKGMISPGVFIPFLEKTGFVAELDAYIWEEVCKWQRAVLDSGYEALPVSVNVSRVDIYSMDVPAYFCKLLHTYDLPSSLIEVEITESTYTEDNEFVNRVISELRQFGFRVLMDDFGSGYSSLNMLKDVEVDVLKMDMRFLDINENNANKGKGILETVLNMVDILGIDIIVEGVETEEQKDFLLKMGSGYGQGYYFYRPMPVPEFEALLHDRDNLDFEGFRDQKIEKLHLKDMLSENMFNEVMLNNMLGAVVFYDECQGEITLRRYNANYEELIKKVKHHPDARVNFRQNFDEENYQKFLRMFEKARQNRMDGAEDNIQRCGPNGEKMWLHIRAFFLKEQDGHRVYYGSPSDVTEVYRKNEVLTQQNAELQFLNNDMPGGYYRHKNNADGDFIFISKRFLDIVGFTRKEIAEQFNNKFVNMIHPDDREIRQQSRIGLEQNGGNSSQPYRIRSKNGYIVVTDQSRLVQYDGHEFFQGIILCNLGYDKQLADEEYLDTGESIEDETTNFFMPCGVFKYETDGGQQFSYVSNSMLNMLGYNLESFKKKFNNCFVDMVYEEDRTRIAKEIKEQIRTSNYVSCEYRIEMADGSLKWIYNKGRLIVDANGKRWFYASIVEYDYLKKKYLAQEWQLLKYRTLSEIPGMITYDYEPDFDRMTFERASQYGDIETTIQEKFVENMDSHKWLAQEGIENQKKIIKAALTRPMNGSIEFRARIEKDKDFQWYRTFFKSIADEDGKVYRMVGRADNIESEIDAILSWKKRTMKDALTELWNSETVKGIINESIQKYQTGILFLIDVDDFRHVNDIFGTEKGDEFLRSVADIIRSMFRKEDILVRFGGDEFLIYAPGVCGKELAEKRAKELFSKIGEVDCLGSERVKCSIGIAIANNDKVLADQLIDQADAALERAKREGKNRYFFYAEE